VFTGEEAPGLPEEDSTRPNHHLTKWSCVLDVA